jgi:hypothetical protein
MHPPKPNHRVKRVNSFIPGAKDNIQPPPTGNPQEPLPISDDEMEEAPSGYIPEVAGDEYEYVPLKERRQVYSSTPVEANCGNTICFRRRMTSTAAERHFSY